MSCLWTPYSFCKGEQELGVRQAANSAVQLCSRVGWPSWKGIGAAILATCAESSVPAQSRVPFTVPKHIEPRGAAPASVGRGTLLVGSVVLYLLWWLSLWLPHRTVTENNEMV